MSLHTTTHGEFSVYQWFLDGTYECVAEFVGDKEAVEIAGRMMTSVGAKIGTTTRVIITEGDDYINLEWVFGKGVVFPPQEKQHEH